MPMYTYQCPMCDGKQDGMRLVADRHDSPFCDSCGVETKFIIAGCLIAPINGAGSGTGVSGLTKRAKSFFASQH